MKNKFLDLLNNNKFEEIEELLYEDVYDVEDMMDLISDEDYKKIEPHWSAVQTGEIISTPIEVLKEVSDYIQFKKNSTLIDIGSGHGFPSFVFSALNPSLKIIGYELVKEKVNGALSTSKKIGLDNVIFKEQDLSKSDFTLESADYFYIYNSANEDVLENIINQICDISNDREVTLISSGGVNAKFLKARNFTEDKALSEYGVVIFNKK